MTHYQLDGQPETRRYATDYSAPGHTWIAIGPAPLFLSDAVVSARLPDRWEWLTDADEWAQLVKTKLSVEDAQSVDVSGWVTSGPHRNAMT